MDGMKPLDEVAKAVQDEMLGKRAASWKAGMGRSRAASTPSATAVSRPGEQGDGPVCPRCRGAGWLKVFLNGRDILGGSKLVPCECKSEELAKKVWEKARTASNLSGELRHLTFDYFDQRRQPEAYQAALDFAHDPERNWLVLVGGVGTGKSHLLAAVVNKLLAGTRWHPVYHVLPDMLRHLRRGFNQHEGESEESRKHGSYEERMDRIARAEVLLLDDYGAEQPTQWGDETLFVLIDHRWAQRLPTVVATNLLPAAMPARIASRLFDRGRSRVITMREGDYRQSDARAQQPRLLRPEPPDDDVPF